MLGCKSDCIKHEKLFCWVLNMGFDGRKLLLGESRVQHPPCRCGPRNCNFPLRVRKFLASRRKQRHKSWRKRGFATETKGEGREKKEEEPGVVEGKSVGNYNIHFDKRERRDRIRYSLCPRVIYYLDARELSRFCAADSFTVDSTSGCNKYSYDNGRRKIRQ